MFATIAIPQPACYFFVLVIVLLLVLVRIEHEQDYEQEHEDPFGCGPEPRGEIFGLESLNARIRCEQFKFPKGLVVLWSVVPRSEAQPR